MNTQPYSSNMNEENFQELQNDFGSPVIVNSVSPHFSAMQIPGTLKDAPLMNSFQNDSDGQSLFNEVGTGQDDANDSSCIIVAESVNPSTVPQVKESFTEGKVSNRNRKQKSRINRTPQNSDSMFDEEMRDLSSVSINDTVTSEVIENQIEANQSITGEILPHFYSLGGEVIVIMEPSSYFCFTGKLRVRVLSGAIEVYGSLFMRQSEPVDIYAPKGHSCVAIWTSSKYLQPLDPDIWMYLSAEGVDPSVDTELKTDLDQCRPGTAVLVLMNIENKLTKFLDVFCSFKIFPRIDVSTNYSWTDPKRAEVVLQSYLYFGTQTCKYISMNPQIVSDITGKMLSKSRNGEWSCSLIAGGKNVGKSTASRYLINNLLLASETVVLLDLDPGQTEFTPPGCVSYSLVQKPLMGPNFTHLKSPIYQLYIGDVNVTRCIIRYIEAVKKLFERLSGTPELSRLPIIVNTMGFCKGIGWDILVFIIKLVQPSLVVQIQSKTAKNNFHDLLSTEIIDRQQLTWVAWNRNTAEWNKPCSYELVVIPSDAERKSKTSVEMWNMQPYQHRELVLFSYLSEIAVYNNESLRHTVYPSINAAVPYIMPFPSLYIALPQNSVPPTHVFAVINGNIVALCGFDKNTTGSETPPRGPRILIRPPLCTCYGFGIVRGVDMAKEELYINTALPLSILQYVNCLVGCIPLPSSLLSVHQEGAPYVGGSVDLPTSREHRRGYFRFRNRNNT